MRKVVGADGCDILSSSASITHDVKSAYFCNTSGAEDTLSLCVLSKGEDPDDTKCLLKNLAIAGEDTLICDAFPLYLEQGERLWGKSANGTITATVAFRRLTE